MGKLVTGIKESTAGTKLEILLRTAVDGLTGCLCYVPLLCQTAKHIVQMSSYGSSIHRTQEIWKRNWNLQSKTVIFLWEFWNQFFMLNIVFMLQHPSFPSPPSP